jgi:hypothetical protein
MPGGHYASGNWRVKAGSEEEFIARWQALLTASARPSKASAPRTFCRIPATLTLLVVLGLG